MKRKVKVLKKVLTKQVQGQGGDGGGSDVKSNPTTAGAEREPRKASN